MDKPERIEAHQEDYKVNAWQNYTIAELGNWIHLFHKRSSHRNNEEKAKKDLYDAKNYLSMIDSYLKEQAKNLNISYEEL